MKAAGIRSRAPAGKLVALLIIAGGVGAGLYALERSSLQPSTDDATIDADVVHVAAAVGGRIIDIPVAENMQVQKGDLLFQIDPIPYRLAVAQAEADLGIAEAALDTQRRVLSTQRSTAAVAGDQVQRAVADLALANRTVERLRPLAASGYVPIQQLDQAQTLQRDATTSLQQAREQANATARAVDTEAGAEATVRGGRRWRLPSERWRTRPYAPPIRDASSVSQCPPERWWCPRNRCLRWSTPKNGLQSRTSESSILPPSRWVIAPRSIQ
jgi:multidrug efflux system membrane fusion protein